MSTRVVEVNALHTLKKLFIFRVSRAEPRRERTYSRLGALFHGQFCPGSIGHGLRIMETAHLILSLFLLSLCAHWANGYAQDDARRSTTGRAEDNVPTESTAVATTEQSLRHPRWYKRGDHDEEHGHDENDEGMDDDDETKAISRGKIDYWGGYYDFLINEGSYKFWAVFQLATAALLVYSGFAAVYYAKVNPPASEDYDDDFLRRRRRRRSDAFLGLGPETFQRILDAVNDEFQSHRSSRLSQ